MLGWGGREGEAGPGVGEATGTRGAGPGNPQWHCGQVRVGKEREGGEWVSHLLFLLERYIFVSEVL